MGPARTTVLILAVDVVTVGAGFSSDGAGIPALPATLDGLVKRPPPSSQVLARFFETSYTAFLAPRMHASAALYGDPQGAYIEVDLMPARLPEHLTPAEALACVQAQFAAPAGDEGPHEVGGIATDVRGHSWVCGDFDDVKSGLHTTIGSFCFFVRNHRMGAIDIIGLPQLQPHSLLQRFDR